MLDLNKIAKDSWEIAQKRGKHGLPTDTIGVLKWLSGEVVEATDAYKEYQNVTTSNKLDSYKSELADIIVCVLIAAANSNIDIEHALKDCVEKNRKRSLGIGDKW